MAIAVGTLWIIYAAVLLGTWLLSWWLLNTAASYYDTLAYGTAFLFATLIAAIAAFIAGAWLDPNQLTDSDKSWLTVLFMIACLLPILVVIYMLWIGYSCVEPCINECRSECSRVKQQIHCNRETGQCYLQKKTIYQPNGDRLKIVYTNH